jgi:hypothetical protein
MSDTIGEITVKRTIGGESVSFLKLTPYDRAAILRDLKKRDRDNMLADLKAVGADKGEMLAELRDMDARVYGEPEFIGLVNTADGQVAVLDIAMRDIDPAKRETLRRNMVMSGSETLRLVAELCNLEVGGRAEGDDPNPLSPAKDTTPDTYQTPTNPTTTDTESSSDSR